MRYHLIIVGILAVILASSVSLVLAGTWKGPLTYPPDNGNVQLIGASGNDQFGDHRARANVNVDGNRIYNIGVSNNAYSAAVAATSSAGSYSMSGSIMARGNAYGVSATSNSAIQPTVIAKNTGSGYALYASSTRNNAAYFGQLLQVAGKKAVLEFPGSNNLLYVGWQPNGVQAPGDNLYWGNNLLCDKSLLDCGWKSVSSGDNLGNHIAGYKLDMNNFRVINVSNDVSSTEVKKASSIAAAHTFSGNAVDVPVALSSGAEQYFGVYAQTSLGWNTTRQSFSLPDQNGAIFSRPAVWKDKVYWGTVQYGNAFSNYLLSHTGLRPMTTGNPANDASYRQRPITELCPAVAPGVPANLPTAAIAAYQDKLYVMLRDNDIARNQYFRLLIRSSDGTNSCLSYSQLSKPGDMTQSDFNTIRAFQVYKDKLYAFATNGCRLLSYNNDTWTGEAAVPASDFNDCVAGTKMMEHNGLLYLMIERANGSAYFYTYNGATLSKLSNTAIATAVPSTYVDSGISNGWAFDGDAMYVGSGDKTVKKFDGQAWSTYGSIIQDTPCPNAGPADLYFYRGKLFIYTWQCSNFTPYVWNTATSHWDNDVVGGMGAFYRGALIFPNPGLGQTFSQPSAALGYSAGVGYGINAFSLAGPGARFFGKTQIMDDPDINLPGQLVFGSETNRLALQPGVSEAASDLYWGDKLLCDASQSNCGWAASGAAVNSLWQAVGNDAYTDYLVSLGGPAAVPRQKLDLLVATTSAVAITDTKPIVNANSLFVDDTYLYVSANQGGSGNLLVYSLTTPGQLTLIGSDVNSSGGAGLGVYGHYAYAANGTVALDVTNVQNPANPQFVRTVNLGFADAYGVRKTVVSGSTLYLITSNRLFALDITDPSNPQIISSLALGNNEDLFLQGKYAYVTRGSSGLRIIDISNPASLTAVASYDPGAQVAQQVIVRGKIAYVLFAEASGGSPAGAVQAIDVSDPANPALIRASAGVSGVKRMALVGNYIYVPTELLGWKIFDVENPYFSMPEVGPSALFFLGQLTGDAIAVSGNYLYAFMEGAGIHNLVAIRLPSARLQTLQAGSAAIDSLSVSGQLNAGNLYAGSGLLVGGNMTITNGPLIVGGSLKIGNTTLTAALLQQLKTWLANP